MTLKKSNNKDIIHLSGNSDNLLPEGFTQWYMSIKQIQSSIFFQIDDLLEDNDAFGAVELFEEKTKYNPTKKWH